MPCGQVLCDSLIIGLAYSANYEQKIDVPPQAGSCNYYSGANSSTASKVTVPTIMRAGAADYNLDFAGSCGR